MATATPRRKSRPSPRQQNEPLPDLILQVRDGDRVIQQIALPDPRIVYAAAYREWYPNRTICFVKAGKGVSV